jgi:hypothetical protein
MEDGIERMMSPETYNIHFLKENKIEKINVKEISVVNDVKDSIIIKESCLVKESSLTNPQ